MNKYACEHKISMINSIRQIFTFATGGTMLLRIEEKTVNGLVLCAIFRRELRVAVYTTKTEALDDFRSLCSLGQLNRADENEFLALIWGTKIREFDPDPSVEDQNTWSYAATYWEKIPLEKQTP